MNRILQLFIQTRMNGKFIDFDIEPMNVIRRAESEGLVHRFKKDTYICMYKTKYKDSDAIIMFITMKLPGTSAGSSDASKIIMEIVTNMEKTFFPINYMYLKRDSEGNNKTIGILTMIKQIYESDMI